jgi:hypothetical protein
MKYFIKTLIFVKRTGRAKVKNIPLPEKFRYLRAESQ